MLAIHPVIAQLLEGVVSGFVVSEQAYLPPLKGRAAVIYVQPSEPVETPVEPIYPPVPEGVTLASLERTAILEAVADARSLVEAASWLGIRPATLRAKCRAYHLPLTVGTHLRPAA